MKLFNLDDWSKTAVASFAMIHLALLVFGAAAVVIRIPRITTITVADVPVEMAWFGAVGAAAVSLQGLFKHRGTRWSPEYNLWHLGRPYLGAVFGFVSYMMLRVLADVATPNEQPLPPWVDGVEAFPYRVLAFLVGYREETFRELLKRVVDVILGPGGPRYDATRTNRPERSESSKTTRCPTRRLRISRPVSVYCH